MRLLIPLVLAGIGFLAKQEVNANPLSVIVVTNTGVVGPHIPVAPAPSNDFVPLAPASGDQIPKRRHRCAMMLRNKLINFANTFRIAFGLPIIQTLPDVDISINPVSTVNEEVPKHEDQPHHHPHHHKHHHFHHKKLHGTFLQRIHRALMALGPWEGRAIAFVLGCGIGVLLRMIWVMTIVTYRMIKCDKEESEIRLVPDEQSLLPPRYSCESEDVKHPLILEPVEVIFKVDTTAEGVDESRGV